MLSFAEMKSIIELNLTQLLKDLSKFKDGGSFDRPDILKMLTDNTKPLEENK